MFDTAFIQELARELAPKVAELIRPMLNAKIAPRYLNLEQAAEYLSSTKDGVRGMARAKRFPVKKMNGRIYIDIQDIDRSMSESTLYLKAA